jgi:hypothetical protein
VKAAPALPPFPLSAWRASKETLHLYAQMVGKVRLATAPPLDHWWHVTLRVSPRGLRAPFIPLEGGGFEMEFDLVDHALEVRTAKGEALRIPLRDGLSVATLHRRLFQGLRDLGIAPRILAKPYDVPFATTPFAKDERHAAYDPEAVATFGRLLRWAAGIFEEFAGRFAGKQSPVHFFWHSFDLALTRFSGRPAPALPAGSTHVERVAYADEVASFGFWPGDEDVPAPAFYAYAAPVPDGLTTERLAPRAAKWLPDASEGMAVLLYDAVRRAADPRKAVLSFFESAFRAATKRARWPKVGTRA